MRCAINSPTVETGQGRKLVLVQIVAMLCAGLLVLGALRPARAQGPADEYKVKAAFIFHFAQLVDWPADGLNAGDQSLNICVFEDESRLLDLQSTLEGKMVGSRALHVRLLNQLQDARGCNILFISRDDVRRQAAILRTLRGQPVLTVGETAGFLSDGGMIRLYLEKDKIRFDINASSADSSHLKISSRLLLLATTVTLGSEKDQRR